MRSKLSLFVIAELVLNIICQKAQAFCEDLQLSLVGLKVMTILIVSCDPKCSNVRVGKETTRFNCCLQCVRQSGYMPVFAENKLSL